MFHSMQYIYEVYKERSFSKPRPTSISASLL